MNITECDIPGPLIIEPKGRETEPHVEEIAKELDMAPQDVLDTMLHARTAMPTSAWASAWLAQAREYWPETPTPSGWS